MKNCTFELLLIPIFQFFPLSHSTTPKDSATISMMHRPGSDTLLWGKPNSDGRSSWGRGEEGNIKIHVKQGVQHSTNQLHWSMSYNRNHMKWVLQHLPLLMYALWDSSWSSKSGSYSSQPHLPFPQKTLCLFLERNATGNSGWELHWILGNLWAMAKGSAWPQSLKDQLPLTVEFMGLGGGTTEK